MQNDQHEVATPGRLIDALHKGMIRLDEAHELNSVSCSLKEGFANLWLSLKTWKQVRFLVLDEVDRMMELGGVLQSA